MIKYQGFLYSLQSAFVAKLGLRRRPKHVHFNEKSKSLEQIHQANEQPLHFIASSVEKINSAAISTLKMCSRSESVVVPWTERVKFIFEQVKHVNLDAQSSGLKNLKLALFEIKISFCCKSTLVIYFFLKLQCKI